MWIGENMGRSLWNLENGEPRRSELHQFGTVHSRSTSKPETYSPEVGKNQLGHRGSLLILPWPRWNLLWGYQCHPWCDLPHWATFLSLRGFPMPVTDTLDLKHRPSVHRRAISYTVVSRLTSCLSSVSGRSRQYQLASLNKRIPNTQHNQV